MTAPRWAPGASPFHAKGALFEAAQQFYVQEVPGGLDAVLRGLDEPERAFLDRRFQARDDYDVLPLVTINAAAARLVGVAADELNRRGARWTAERDLRGLAKLVLRMLSPATLALKLPKLAMRYFDFGEADSTLDGPRRCRVTQAGIPVVLADWMLSATEGFSLVGLERTGARAPVFRAKPSRPDGETHGVPTVTLEFELSWS
jgi:hypothetical protein